MRDLQGRVVDYMRISITDRCNLRCRYCMPEGIRLIPMEELLTFEEILEVCCQAVVLGIRKFKITGGEPLVRKGCAKLISDMKKLPGVEQVTMTTNGILLKDYLEELTAGGLDGVNISLDTLNRERFREITGFDRLEAVLASVKAAVDAGVQVKVNTVLQAGINDGEWKNLAELSRNRKLDVRFIEMMPIGQGRHCRMVPNQEVFSRIQKEYPEVCKDERIHGNGPAVYCKIPGFCGSIGFISAVHGRFCSQCNRIRMTAVGGLKPCLCYEEGISVRSAVRKGSSDEIRDILKRAILMKPAEHCFERKQEITEYRKMVQIGG